MVVYRTLYGPYHLTWTDNDYLHRFKRENQTTRLYTYEPYSHPITLKNDIIIISDGRSHNHTPKLCDNVQDVLARLKHRLLTDDDRSVGEIYDEEMKKFVGIFSFLCIPTGNCFCSFLGS